MKTKKHILKTGVKKHYANKFAFCGVEAAFLTLDGSLVLLIVIKNMNNLMENL